MKTSRLLVVILSLIVDNVEEAELVNTLARRYYAEPISELLLLKELLCARYNVSSVKLEVELVRTYRYFKYLPLKGMCATTSILPSPACEMEIWSPKLPVRPSILILSCKNFSNAFRSKILSETGCEQLMVYYSRDDQSCRDRMIFN